MTQRNQESTVALSDKALFVTVAVYGVEGSNGVSLTRHGAMDLFSELSLAADQNREKPRKQRLGVRVGGHCLKERRRHP